MGLTLYQCHQKGKFNGSKNKTNSITAKKFKVNMISNTGKSMFAFMMIQ